MTELRCRKTETLMGDKEEDDHQSEPEGHPTRKFKSLSSLLTEQQLASSANFS